MFATDKSELWKKVGSSKIKPNGATDDLDVRPIAFPGIPTRRNYRAGASLLVSISKIGARIGIRERKVDISHPFAEFRIGEQIC